METRKKHKMSLLGVAGALLLISSWSIFPEVSYPEWSNDFIRSLKAKLSAYSAAYPEDRIYLQLDKPFYEPGDDLWFSAYVRDGSTLKSSTQSEILYVELIDPKGAVSTRLNLLVNKGVSKGDVDLGEDLPGGIYKLRAYTNWMKNVSEENYFEKEFQVQKVLLPNLKMKMDFVKKSYGPGDEVQVSLSVLTNENKPLATSQISFQPMVDHVKLKEGVAVTNEEGQATLVFKLPSVLKTTDGLLNVMMVYQGSTESISRSIPIVLNKIALQLFPEGGELINGVEGRVAFCAKNEFGKPADVAGVILDSRGNKVTEFKSIHQGMGEFFIVPAKNERYEAKILTPVPVAEPVKLPGSLEKGYQLAVTQATSAGVDLQIYSPLSTELNLVAQVRGKIYYSTAIKAIQGKNKLYVSTADFPAGVAMFTLFDHHGIERAERLVFVNKHRQMQITVNTDKEKYLPREKVKMSITVKDEEGFPLPAHLSLSVVNDQLISFADNRDGHLVSTMLLEHDLKDKVIEPSFYFNPKEPLADRALDLLMLTSGWRRFTWEEIIDEKPIAINYLAERQVISGEVIDANTGKKVPGALIKEGERLLAKTDSAGRFTIKGLDLSSDHVVVISGSSFQPQSLSLTEYNQDMSVYLYSTNYRAWSGNKMKRDGRAVPQRAMEAEDLPMMAASEANMFQPAVAEHQEKAAEKPVARTGDVIDIDNDRIVSDKRFMQKKTVVVEGKKYYRARQFPLRKYEQQSTPVTRTDFPSTLYWNPDVVVNHKGRADVEFYTSDEITSFAGIIEGISPNGLVGRAEKRIYTQLPFQLRVKLPQQVVSGDVFTAPITLINNTDKPLGGKFTLKVGEGLRCLNPIEDVQTIMPHSTRIIPLQLSAGISHSLSEIELTFNSCSLEDAVKNQVLIVPKGFPVSLSFSGQAKNKELVFETKRVVAGSMRITFNAFPDVTTDLLKGVEGILQEPYGCFEQTSCTAYPNAMVIDYLKQTGKPDAHLLARANALMDRGYKRLVGFEAGSKGYEWFGSSPAHEGLTAYGIMEFIDMQKAGQAVDEEMLRRTINWLLSHRDGKGGFEREKRALHDFGRISDDVLNAYIVFALAEAGIKDIEREFDASEKRALSTADPYLLSLTAIAAYDLGKKKEGDVLYALLLKEQAEDGSFNGKSHSITYSEGQSLKIETTALAILATLKQKNEHQAELNKSVKFLLASRSGSGVFSSTQGTILSLKALTAFASHSKKMASNGKVELFVDGKKVAEQRYLAGSTKAITLTGLESFLKGERHQVRINFAEGEALPYTFAVNYFTDLPDSDKACEIQVQTNITDQEIKVGETTRLVVKLENTGNRDLPSAIGIVGLPAGCSAQPWQLKELQEQGVFDYYEIKDNAIAFYFRGMAQGSTAVINLDLKAEIAGTYVSPASCAYLYYKNELKSWSSPNKVKVN